MSNYTKTTNFAAKDSLPSGNAGKIVKGTEIDAEFNNIATASATKADINDATLTGTTTFGSLNDGTITITGWVDEDNMSSNSAVLVPTQQSVKAYVDSTTTAQDLDVTDGSSSIDIDLDSESLGILGGTGVTSTASGTNVTLAIDSTVATLTGSQTLTNKTLTTPTILTSFTIGSATISEAELEILDGATVTTAELNVLDGITSTTAELNILDGVTSTAAEINILDGVTSTTAELNILDGVTSSATELNILDGVTATTAELNILDGVTSTAAELNILDGVTSTTAELNILDGVTSTATELNLLDGVTATTAELNYTDGVTSAIQTQLDSKISGADAALTGNATITTADDTVQLALISTSADANAGPILDLFRNSVSAADNDLTGQVYFSGKNDADEKTYYGQITSQISDVSNGSEDFNLELSTLTAGSSNSRLLVTPTETVFNEQSADLDFRIESDGNTNAFFLEGSSGNVGIGGSPLKPLHVFGPDGAGEGTPTFNANVVAVFQNNGTSTDSTILSILSGSASTGFIGFGTATDDIRQAIAANMIDDSLELRTGNNSTALTISANGNLDIGSPAEITGLRGNRRLVLNDTDQGVDFVAYASDNGLVDGQYIGGFLFGNDDNNATEDHFAGMWANASSTAGSMELRFAAGRGNYENNTPHMILDANGNVLVGKTTTDFATAGTEIMDHGEIQVTRDGVPMYLRRNGSDGDILSLYKDGTAVGSIGAGSGELIIGTADTGLRFFDFGDAIIPRSTSNGTRDATTDLGASGNRFKDLYLSGGVVFSDASGSGTSTANTLDDYEEGYFTGTIADASSGGNTGSTHTGYYTKIGELVTVSINLNNITTSGLTSSNTLYLRGLPFTAASTNFSLGVVRPHGVVFQSSRTGAGCQVGASDTFMTFYAFGSGLSDTPIDVGDITSGTSDIIATIQYRA